jgi:hypothetical protein
MPPEEQALVTNEAHGAITIPAEERPPGTELVPGAVNPPGHITVRPLSSAEGFRRLAARQRALAGEPTPESDAERALRAQREADVVEAARRSQAEIRRHVDSYLKEHFETLVADVTNLVIERVMERFMRGLSGMQETQAVQLDRMASDVRAQLRAFARKAWGPAPAKKAQRATKSRAHGRR